MSEFEKWSADTWVIKPLHEIIAEYNALHTAWQESQAELERIGKINDSMCDTIAELEKQLHESIMAELESRHAPIRVPFTDAQIDTMAKACRNKFECDDRWEQSAYQEEWKDSIRAALAAGGLEPCAAPERASDEELSEVACSVYHTGKPGAERDTLAARVAELEAIGVNLQQQAAEHYQASLTIRAELEAAQAERDALRSPDEETLQIASVLENAIHEYVGQVDAGEVATTRSECVEIALFIRDALINARMLPELAALRQPVDADAWKTPLELPLDNGRKFVFLAAETTGDYGIQLDMGHGRWETLWFRANQIATAIPHLASYAAAHGCPMGLPAPETRPVKVRFDVTVQDLLRDVGLGLMDSEGQKLINYLAAHAVLPVPAGVPSVEELVKIGQGASVSVMEKIGLRASGEYDTAFATAIRNAVLASLPHTTPHEPTDAEVEALARALDEAYGHWDKDWDTTHEEAKNGRRNQARAAFAHIGAPKPIASADTLEQLAEVLQRAMTGGECAGKPSAAYRNGVAAILRAAKARVDCKWSELCDAANYDLDGNKEWSWTRVLDFANSRIVYGVTLPADIGAPGPLITVPKLPTGPTRAEAEAKLREVNAKECYYVSVDHAWKWLLPQLPGERAEMPSAEELARIVRRHASDEFWDKSTAEAILTALRPWLNTPTGWELDVTWQEVQAAYYRHQSGSPEGQCWHQVIDLLRSRIRPAFGPCKECALLRSRLEQSERMSDKRHEISHRYHQDIKKAHAVLSAALEVE